MKRKYLAITAAALALSMLSTTAAFAQGWGKVGSKWFYYNEDGSCAKNMWITEQNEDGTPKPSYWVNNDGTMAVSQWVNDGNGWVYVDGNGVTMASQLLVLNSDTYYLKEDGRMAAGEWIKEEGKWYYFQDNGIALKNGWKTVGDESYYFLKNCVLATDALVPGGGRVDSEGRLVK